MLEVGCFKATSIFFFFFDKLILGFLFFQQNFVVNESSDLNQ